LIWRSQFSFLPVKWFRSLFSIFLSSAFWLSGFISDDAALFSKETTKEGLMVADI